MIYCDTNYIVRAYLDEPGSEQVRSLFDRHEVASCVLIKAEVPAALHRSYREGRHSLEAFQETLACFQDDLEQNILVTLPLGDAVWGLTGKRFRDLPPTTFLRAADALHLACAAEHGFTEVYSNDRHLLAAAPLFGLNPRNVIT